MQYLVLSVVLIACLHGSEELAEAIDVNKTSTCGDCDLRFCATVNPDLCDGSVVKDGCNCCPVCVPDDPSEADNSSARANGTDDEAACQQFECPRFSLCLLNIQGLPVCRCPNNLYCRRKPRNEICSEDGKTYKNVCYLKMEECISQRNIQVKHHGGCESDVNLDFPNISRKKAMRIKKLEDKQQAITSRLERLRNSAIKKKQKNRQPGSKKDRQQARREERLAMKAERKAERRQGRKGVGAVNIGSTGGGGHVTGNMNRANAAPGQTGETTTLMGVENSRVREQQRLERKLKRKLERKNQRQANKKERQQSRKEKQRGSRF